MTLRRRELELRNEWRKVCTLGKEEFQKELPGFARIGSSGFHKESSLAGQ
jgi:hypothetical protein